MEFHLLGPLEVLAAGQPVPVRGAKYRTLLAVLLVHANRPVGPERIVELLWPVTPPATARETVRYMVYQLRKAFALGGQPPDAVLATTRSGYRLNVTGDQLDLDRFRSLRATARTERAGGRLDRAAALTEQALALWRGPALEEFADEPFARDLAGRLEEERLLTFEELGEIGLLLGRHERLADQLTALVRAHPTRTALHAQRILALLRTRGVAPAQAAYREAWRDGVTGLGLALQHLRRQAREPITSRRRSAGTLWLAGPSGRRTGSDGGPAAPAGRKRLLHQERRIVTVLAAGPAGPVDQDPGPDGLGEARVAARTVLVRRILGVIERFGGTVVTARGWVVVAAFGCPSAREDDPERAVRAGLEIRRLAGDACVGVATGVALLQRASALPVATPRCLDERLVRVAIDLHDAAEAAGVLVSEAAWRATRRVLPYADRWRAGPLAAWRPLDGPVAVAAPEGPLVEREHALRLLTGLLRRTSEQRQPLAVTLEGGPGVGKTRLVQELYLLASADRDRQVTWLQGHCRPFGGPERGMAFDPLAQALAGYAGIMPAARAAVGADRDRVERKLRNVVATVLGARDAEIGAVEVARVSAMLRRLLAVEPAGAHRDPILPGQREEAFAAWARFLEAVAAIRPLVLVVENLHWAGGALMDFLNTLTYRVKAVPLLLVCTTRPNGPGQLDRGAGPRGHVHTLSPLSPDGSRQLLTALLDRTGLRLEADATDRLLEERTGGNPLYLEEYVRLLRELPPGYGAPAIPETLHQLVTTRIDALADGDRRLLRDAAVLGEVGDLATLAALDDAVPAGNEGVARLRQGLERLASGEFLRRDHQATSGGASVYRFRHDLVRDIALGQLDPEERAGKHWRAAVWADKLGDAMQAAWHYREAVALARVVGALGTLPRERARDRLRAAGDTALWNGAYADAASFFETALALWPKDAAAGREEHEQRAMTLFCLALARTYGEHEGEPLLEQARTEFSEIGALEKAAEVELLLGLSAVSRGDPVQGQRWLDQAASRRGLRPGRAAAMVKAFSGVFCMIDDRHDDAVGHADAAIRMFEEHVRDGGPVPRAIALTARGAARLKRGDPAGAAELTEGIRLLSEHGHPNRHYSQFNLAWGWWCHGGLAECAEAAAAGRDAATAARAAASRWFDAMDAILAYADGRWDDARAFLEPALRGTISGQEGWFAPWYWHVHAQIALGRGELDTALGSARQALALATQRHSARFQQLALSLLGWTEHVSGQRHEAARTLGSLLELQRGGPPVICVTPEQGLLLVALGEPADRLPTPLDATRWHAAVWAVAERDFTAAVRRYDAVGSRIDAALVRLVAAAYHQRGGRRSEAWSQLRAATQVFLDAGADGWMRQADELRARLS